ncbi:MAG TPA: LysM peptidoglycan-binding domain-containing protein [Acidimicrobiales bacterium]
MTAIAYPSPHPRQVQLRPQLRVVRGVPRQSEGVYRRRRLGAAVLVALAVVALFALAAVLRPNGTGSTAVHTEPASGAVVSDPSAYGASHVDPPAGSVYVVQPGDTLWSIAHKLRPEGDVRAEVDRLAGLNGSSALQAGQRLRLAGDDGS